MHVLSGVSAQLHHFGRRKQSMDFFFATPDDLLPVLLDVEGRRALAYTQCGHVNEPNVRSFCSAKELPTHFKTAPHEAYVHGPSYLVTEAGKPIALRQLAPFGGQVRWAIDQLTNSDSTELSHGGFLWRANSVTW